MADQVRRRVTGVQLSLMAAVLGLLGGLGLGRGAAPPRVDAEPQAGTLPNSLTINGGSIKDGSVKFKDLDKGSIQKSLYLKTQADRLFLKIKEAEARYIKLGALAGYIKLDAADARFLKLDAAASYIKLDAADARFLKLSDADSRFVKLDALSNYIKLDTADARFLKLDALEGYIKLDTADARFIKLDTADARYLKLNALDGYIKLADADARFIKLDAADARYLKLDALDGYIKLADADKRFVAGDGSVRTGSEITGDANTTVLEVPKTLRVLGRFADQGVASVTLVNLTDAPLSFASTLKNGQGSPVAGTIAPQTSSTAILIGLLQPATFQVIDPRARGSVHTLSLTAFSQPDNKVQVVGQILSGSPPPAG